MAFLERRRRSSGTNIVSKKIKGYSKQLPALSEKPPQPQPQLQPQSQSRPSIFTVGSPERAKKKNDELSSTMKEAEEERGVGFQEFLGNCFLCKKKLLPRYMDMYMYGYLRAFCSPECRKYQMALDGFDEENSEESMRFLLLLSNN